MSDHRSVRVGFVSLGRGPRPDLQRMHERLFAARGYWLDSVWAHVLEDIPEAKLAGLRAADDEPAIRALHGATPDGQAPREKSWFSRAALTELLPRSIASVEARGVELTIVCAAEMLPEFSARTGRPVLLPAEAMAAQARMLALTRPGASIGLVVYGDRQRAQQARGWHERDFAADLSLHFSGAGDDADRAVADLAPLQPELVFVWAYGAATGEGAPERISRALRAPVVSAAEAAVSMAMMFLARGGHGR